MQLHSDYFGVYRSLKLTRDTNGVLVVEFHSNGGPCMFSALHHAEVVDAFHRIGQDRGNKIVILTGAAGDFIIGVDWSSFGDASDPGVWSQIHDEGTQVLENIANIRVPVIAAIEGRAHIHSDYALLANVIVAAEGGLPYYEKWSLEVEKQFGANTALTAGYVGNHGLHESTQFNSVNAFAPLSAFPGGFTGLPTAAPDPEFGQVNGLYNNAISDYHGLTVSVVHRYSSGQFSINYTYSHALDEISNGGFATFASAQFGATNNSIQFPQTPFNLRANYGPADYDIRHQLNANYVWELPLSKLTFGHGPDSVLKGWQVAGTAFVRSGLPFTPVDLGTSAALNGFGYGGTVFATPLVPNNNQKCTGITSAGPTCIASGLYAASPNGFSTLGRNTLRGPDYFNADFSIMKYIQVPKWEKAKFGIGAQFYNVFNHPNYDLPIANVANTGNFGQIVRTVSGPTSPFGSVLGADASPRLIQLKAQFTF